jgi:hypothetical protein
MGTIVGAKISLAVSNVFLHGQDKEGRNRFLVYHDKDRDIFQVGFETSVETAQS